MFQPRKDESQRKLQNVKGFFCGDNLDNDKPLFSSIFRRGKFLVSSDMNDEKKLYDIRMTPSWGRKQKKKSPIT